MSITETAICNLALREIGAERISDYRTDASKEGRICRDLFHPTRRRVLTMCAWNGAKKTAQPTQMEDTTPSLWTYAFEVPTDLIRLLSVHPSDDLEESTPYELAYQAGSGDDEANVYAILTNAGGTSDGTSTTLYIRYIFDQTDMGALSPGFHDVMSFELARVFAVALGRSEAAKELTTKELRRRITLAKSIDGQEDYPEKMAEGSWMQYRFGRYGGRSTFSG